MMCDLTLNSKIPCSLQKNYYIYICIYIYIYIHTNIHTLIYILKHAYVFIFVFRTEKALRQFFICPLNIFFIFYLHFSSTLNSSGWHYSHSSVRALSEGYEIYHGLFFQPTAPQGDILHVDDLLQQGVPNIFAQLNPHALLGLPLEIVSNVNGSINIMHFTDFVLNNTVCL